MNKSFLLGLLITLTLAILCGVLITFTLPADKKLSAALPEAPALVDDYLATKITATQTTFTLANGTLRDGTALGGYYCFVIDVNSPQVEYVCGTASSTSVTGVVRGIQFQNPNATSSALMFAHNRLASVQITDYPTLQFMVRKINGIDSIDAPLQYSSGSASLITSSTQLASKGYVDNVAFGTSTYWLPSGLNIYYGGTGNIGIGTLTPSTKLHVVGSSTISGNESVGGNITITGTGIIGGLLNFGAIATTTSYSVFINEPALHTLAFNTSGSEAMRINSSGYVGIGTTTPAVSLLVIGSSTISGNFNVGGILNVTGNSLFASGVSLSGFATSTAGFNNASLIGQRSFIVSTATTTIITTTFKPSKVYITGGFGAAYSGGHGSSSGFANLTGQHSSYGSACNAGGSDTYAFYYLTTRNFSGSPCDSAASVTVTIASSSVTLTESGSTDSGTAAYTYLIQ